MQGPALRHFPQARHPSRSQTLNGFFSSFGDSSTEGGRTCGAYFELSASARRAVRPATVRPAAAQRPTLEGLRRAHTPNSMNSSEIGGPRTGKPDQGTSTDADLTFILDWPEPSMSACPLSASATANVTQLSHGRRGLRTHRGAVSGARRGARGHEGLSEHTVRTELHAPGALGAACTANSAAHSTATATGLREPGLASLGNSQSADASRACTCFLWNCLFKLKAFGETLSRQHLPVSTTL